MENPTTDSLNSGNTGRSNIFLKPIEKVLSEYADNKFSEEAYNAKNQFFSLIGLFERDESQFVENINLFHDWYLFERVLTGFNQTPVNAYYQRYQSQMTTTDRILFESLTKTEYSLFEYLKTKKDQWIFYDFIKKTKFAVDQYDSTLHFEEGDIFQSRLIKFDQKYYFGLAFCFHSKDTQSYFKKKIKEVLKKTGKDIAAQEKTFKELYITWLRMNQKHKNFKHVPVSKIYTDTP